MPIIDYEYPIVPSVLNVRHLPKILILIYEGISQKISYERRNYESVDERTHPKLYATKNDEKKNPGTNELIFAKMVIYLLILLIYSCVHEFLIDSLLI